ncbi:MAG: hypothetical protein R3C02_14115 [Planctomycetaceae bacterium]
MVGSVISLIEPLHLELQARDQPDVVELIYERQRKEAQAALIDVRGQVEEHYRLLLSILINFLSNHSPRTIFKGSGGPTRGCASASNRFSTIMSKAFLVG